MPLSMAYMLKLLLPSKGKMVRGVCYFSGNLVREMGRWRASLWLWHGMTLGFIGRAATYGPQGFGSCWWNELMCSFCLSELSGNIFDSGSLVVIILRALWLESCYQRAVCNVSCASAPCLQFSFTGLWLSLKSHSITPTSTLFLIREQWITDYESWGEC